MRHAKTVVPRLPTQFVERVGLRQFLDAQTEPAERGRVVLVSAPVGHGKTVTVADWARATPAVPTAWVSLDASDRDESQWWSSVLGSIARCLDAPVGGPLGPLDHDRATGRPAERLAFVTNALNALDELPTRPPTRPRRPSTRSSGTRRSTG